MKEFVCDCNGKMSATRVVFIAWSLGLLGLLILSMYSNEWKFPEIPSSIPQLFGVVTGGKVIQSWVENKKV